MDSVSSNVHTIRYSGEGAWYRIHIGSSSNSGEAIIQGRVVVTKAEEYSCQDNHFEYFKQQARC